MNRAYQLAWRSGSKRQLSAIELAELLAREGMPLDLADQAARDTLLEVVKGRRKEGRQQMTYGLYVLGLGPAYMIASLVVFKSRIFIPVGVMAFGGALAAFGLARSRSDSL